MRSNNRLKHIAACFLALLAPAIVFAAGCSIPQFQAPTATPGLQATAEARAQQTPTEPGTIAITSLAPTPTAMPLATNAPTPTAQPTADATIAALHNLERTPTPTPHPAKTPTPTAPSAGATVSFTPARLAELDQHALNAPSVVEGSVKELAAYLAQPARDDFEKTRTIYRWITQNIAYDVKAFFAKQYGDQSTEAVFRRRTGVCEGYANLFQSLALAAGVEVVKVPGWAKGLGYSLSELNGDTNHAWNAVKIEGAWYLIDSTWGAGHINESREFVREFNDYYWLAPPHQLVYTHFPEDSRWQLLSPPVTRTGFSALPELKPDFFDLGLQLPPGTTATTQVDSRTALEIVVPDDVLLTAAIEQSGSRLPRTWAFSQRNGSMYEVHAVFPGPGQYDLLLFAKRPDNTDSYPGVAVLAYEVKTGEPAFTGFPTTYAGFQERGVYLYQPLQSGLPVGSKQTFRLRIPGARDAAIIIAKEWTHLSLLGDSLLGDAFEGTAVIAAGEVQVCALFDSGDTYDCLVSYND